MKKCQKCDKVNPNSRQECGWCKTPLPDVILASGSFSHVPVPAVPDSLAADIRARGSDVPPSRPTCALGPSTDRSARDSNERVALRSRPGSAFTECFLRFYALPAVIVVPVMLAGAGLALMWLANSTKPRDRVLGMVWALACVCTAWSRLSGTPVSKLRENRARSEQMRADMIGFNLPGATGVLALLATLFFVGVAVWSFTLR